MSEQQTKRARVFIIQAPDAGKNVLSATEFGELQQPIFPAEKVVMFNSAAEVRELKRALHDYTDDDYILAIGDWLLVGVAQAVASHLNGGKYNLLKWDRETKQYISVAVDIEV